MLNDGETTIYHVISRTALDGFPFGEIEKEEFVKIIKQFSSIYFVDIIGYSVLDNHFHILAKMYPEHNFTDEEIKKRFTQFYGDKRGFGEDDLEYYRKKWSNLSVVSSFLYKFFLCHFLKERQVASHFSYRVRPPVNFHF